MFSPLASQVGGHPGVLSSEDGSLVIKASLPTELAFYESVSCDPNFAPLKPCVPRFYGTLRLAGKVDETTATQDPTSFTVLEANLQYPFLRPNILDIKLGTVLYDEDASPEKRARMEKTARETTSFETGVRLTGFQVYDLTTGMPVITPKSYGKSIRPSDLQYGIARFFPLSPCSSPPTAVSSESTSRTSSPSVSRSASTASTARGIGTQVGTGLPPDILLPVLQAIRRNVAEIRAALARMEVRMVGGSLLVVYEADWPRARAGLRILEEMAARPAHGEMTVEEVEMEDDSEGEEEEEEGDEDDDDEDDDDDDDDDDSRPKPIGPPYVVKLIDFAHTRIVPGRGPDEGVLLGLETVLNLLDGRIDEIRAVS
ncbi:hypothetical protein BKA93DRAFT_725219 [Sparassis latifolia]